MGRATSIEAQGTLRLKLPKSPHRGEIAAVLDPTGEVRIAGAREVITYLPLVRPDENDLAVIVRNSEGQITINFLAVSPKDDLEHRPFYMGEILASLGFSISKTTDDAGKPIFRLIPLVQKKKEETKE